MIVKSIDSLLNYIIHWFYVNITIDQCMFLNYKDVTFFWLITNMTFQKIIQAPRLKNKNNIFHAELNSIYS